MPMLRHQSQRRLPLDFQKKYSFMAPLLIKNQGQCLCLALFLALVVAFCYTPASCTSQLYGEDKIMLQRHEEWMAKHGRVYKDAEEKERRYNIFKSKVEFIEAFNKKKDQNYTLGINKFSDLTHEEFLAMHNGGFKIGQSQSSMSNTFFQYENLTDVPSSVDWREAGIVTPVKFQGSCGSCWAFATVAAAEGVSALKTGNLISLSEQELMDCDTFDQGCHGGGLASAFEYMIKSKSSLATAQNYPYTGTEGGSCKTVAPAAGAIAITGYENVPANENALMKAVANQPVSVGFDYNAPNFQDYSGGVYTGPCGTNLSHAFTIVGYGTSVEGKYWLVKNSYGPDWGEQGYMRVQRDVPAKEGMCGIAMIATYPTA